MQVQVRSLSTLSQTASSAVKAQNGQSDSQVISPVFGKTQSIQEDTREGRGIFINMLTTDEVESKSGQSKLTDLSKSQKAGLEKARQSLEVQKIVTQLKSTDTRVRSHEAAHMGAGSGLITRGASFTYQTGPDGKQYAVGGEVGIDTAAVSGDPQATITKMQQVRAAALAPANPSSQDLSVAASASAIEAQAAAELIAQNNGDSNAEND